jgi:lipopolysaccharide/colanic/teichoic acid biosynthesis glycosyltransferase
MEAHHLTGRPPRTRRRAASHGLSDAARRCLDLLLALALLVFLLPLLAAIAVSIRVDSRGGAVFRQRRVGLGRAPFEVCKFRTMVADADDRPHRSYVTQLIAQDRGCATHGAHGVYKLADDVRVTRVGRFLRRWSLDELPQLWNVVRGEMSLVGPRPVLEYEVDSYPAWYHRRFDVRPGLTGLWQVSGRNEVTYEEMVRFDIDYVTRRSLGLDLKILLKTSWVVLSRKGVA